MIHLATSQSAAQYGPCFSATSSPDGDLGMVEPEQLWAALYDLGTETKGDPDAVMRLIELGIATVGMDGPELTAHGQKCFRIMESGEGQIPELGYPQS